MALITPAQYREHTPALQGTGEDTRLTSVIERVDALMACYCGYPLPDSGGHTLEDVTYTLICDVDTHDPRLLRIPVRPVVSVTSIRVDPTWVYGADTVIVSTDYTLESRSGLVWVHGDAVTLGAWPTERRSVRAIVVAGYATTPPGLVALAAIATRSLLERSDGGDLLSASSARGSWSQAEATSLLPRSVRAGLDAGYRIWGAGAG